MLVSPIVAGSATTSLPTTRLAALLHTRLQVPK